MPFLMTEYAKGSEAVTQADQAAAQRPFVKQEAQDTATLLHEKALSATMNRQVLQDTVAQDKETGAALQRLIQDPKNQGRPTSELARLAAGEARDPRVSMRLLEDSVKFQKQEADAEDAQFKHEQQRKDRQYTALASATPETLNETILGMEADGILKPNESQNLRNLARTLGPEKALEVAKTAYKTDTQKKLEISERAAAERVWKDHQMVQQGWSRIEDANNRFFTRLQQQENTRDNREAAQLGREYRTKVQRLHSDYLKAFNKAGTTEEKNALTSEYQNSLDSMNESYEDTFKTKGLSFTPLVTGGGVVKKEAAPRTPSKQITPEEFNTQWSKLKSGETLVGPDGKTYTKR